MEYNRNNWNGIRIKRRNAGLAKLRDQKQYEVIIGTEFKYWIDQLIVSDDVVIKKQNKNLQCALKKKEISYAVVYVWGNMHIAERFLSTREI